MNNENQQSPIEKMSLKEFSNYYLKSLKDNLRGFGRFFHFLGVLLGISFFISIAFIIVIIVATKNPGQIFQAIPVAINLAAILWFASLCKKFVRLQTEKVENDIYNTIEFREDSANMAKEILEKAERKAENKITIQGDNAVLALDGSTISGVQQTKTVEGESELVKSLALLVSFCEVIGDDNAVVMAKQLSEEATKPNPNKGTVFDLWSKITASLPEVASIVKIAQGIKTFLL